MVYNLNCYLTTEYYFSPHCLQQNISVNSEISFFAWFQVPILHKSECEEPTPKVSQKSICGFPSQAAGCRCIFIEKDRRGGGCTRKKGYREHLDGLHAHFLFLQLLWSLCAFGTLFPFHFWFYENSGCLGKGVGRKQPLKLCFLGMLWTSIFFV